MMRPTKSTVTDVNINHSSRNQQQTQFLPISSLNPNLKSWIIKVRLVRRSEVLVTPNKNNSKNDVKRINMRFQDESGSIQAVAFNDDATRFDSILKVDAIYEISHCMLTKPFLRNDLPNEWELKFTALTKITSLICDPKFAPHCIKYCVLEKVALLNNNDFVNVKGVVENMGEIQTVISNTGRSSGMEFKKRDLLLVDESLENTQHVVLTIWNENAEALDPNKYYYIDAKNVKVKEYCQVISLNATLDSELKIAPFEEGSGPAAILKQWSGQNNPSNEVSALPIENKATIVEDEKGVKETQSLHRAEKRRQDVPNENKKSCSFQKKTKEDTHGT